MRTAVALIIAVLALAGCQTAQESGSPDQCNQVGSNVGSGVMCPSG